MTIGAIVQARMGSTRLPGKVLRAVAAKPLLQYLLERLERCAALDEIVVATSAGAGDDPIAGFCARQGIACHRGPHEDVASRFLEVVDARGFDAFVRICADSPLLDHRLVDRAAALFWRGGGDLVTNVFPRSYPPGQSVEVVSAEAFRRARAEMTDPEDLEHVTRLLYAHPERFRIESFRSRRAYGGLRLAVDTEDDLRRVEEILAAMKRPHWEYGIDEILELAEARGERAA